MIQRICPASARVVASFACVCRGGLATSFTMPELTQLEVRNTTLRAPVMNSRGEWLPEW